jgi:vacuolar-type H+-ATPase subunit C/Vma6
MQLLETADDCFGWDAPFDDTLLKELATGLFQSSQYQVFFEQCHSKAEAKAVEDRLAQELADTYRSILKRHQDPVVQSLNALL